MGASAGFSAGGRTALEGPTALTTALGSVAGALKIWAPTPVPPAGASSCSGAVDGWSLRGGSLGPVGVGAPMGEGAGLPVLTQIGETFAGRVAASLLSAIGLPELIVQTRQQFEGMAIELATQPELMAAIKRKLAENRVTKPLFNTNLYTRHIESAFATMYQRRQDGALPYHIHVAE